MERHSLWAGSAEAPLPRHPGRHLHQREHATKTPLHFSDDIVDDLGRRDELLEQVEVADVGRQHSGPGLAGGEEDENVVDALAVPAARQPKEPGEDAGQDPGGDVNVVLRRDDPVLGHLAQHAFQVGPALRRLRVRWVEPPDPMRDLAERDRAVQQRPLLHDSGDVWRKHALATMDVDRRVQHYGASGGRRTGRGQVCGWPGNWCGSALLGL